MILRPENPAHGGSVVAREEDGRVVFVHYALPGETVEARPIGKRGGAAFFRADAVLEESPDRVEPRCRHFGECGGCQWQHAAYEAQLRFKRKVVEDVWSRAGLRLPADTPVLGMDDPWRYRVRGEFVGIHGGEGGFAFGFHRMRSHSVLAIAECPIHHQRIEQALPAFRQAVADLRLRNLKALLLTAEPGGPGLLWSARFDGRPGAAAEELGARAAELLPEVVVLDDSIGLDLWQLHFRVRSDTFIQANQRQAPVLYRTALEMLALRPGDRVLDLYAGIGTISLAAALEASSVTAVEENPRAVAQGRLAVRINSAENVEFLTGRVEDALRGMRHADHDAVLADPPRAGFEPAAIAELVRLAPSRIAYISCEPSTHARDIALLIRGGYRFRRAAIVDMFPQTYHIESVALLEHSGS